jgi:hypothetical protein
MSPLYNADGGPIYSLEPQDKEFKLGFTALR